MIPELASVKLETLTPALTGGYNSMVFSKELQLSEFPRSQAVKGRIRWWFRALVGGALWECGVSHSELEMESASITKKVLGSLESSSPVLLRLKFDRESWSSRLRLIKKNERPALPPRLNLLRVGRESIAYYEPSLGLNIELVEKPAVGMSDGEKRLAVWSLALFSIFDGLGSITRRGFGALEIKEFKTRFDDIKKRVSDFQKASTAEEAEDTLKKLIHKALEDAHSLVGGNVVQRYDFPPFPLVISPSQGGPFRFRVYDLEKMEPIQLLIKLGETTMTGKWERRRGGRDTWILGLPRKARYLLPEGETRRRVSAISLRPLARRETGWTVLVYGFCSTDWPEVHSIDQSPKIQHLIGRKHQKIWVSKGIRQAFDEALAEIDRLLRAGT